MLINKITRLQSVGVLFLFIFFIVAPNHAENKHHMHMDHKELHKDFSDETGIVIQTAWISSAPPNVKVRAGYFILVNHSDSAIKIVGAESEYFEMIHMHESVIENGLAKMESLDAITLAKGEKLEFKPEGKHLMLMQPTVETLPKKIPVTLLVEGSESVTIMLSIKKNTMMAHGEHHKHH
jgi:copper(I)-binding protein